MYHRIADEPFDPWGLAVSPRRFEAQLAWLRCHRDVIPLPQFADLHRRGTLPARAAAISFDDGYACNAEIAAPLLEASALPATIFLPTELIAAGRECWWDDLERMVLGSGGAMLDVKLPSGHELVQLGRRQPEDGSWTPGQLPATPRQVAFQAIWSMLRGLDPVAQRQAVDGLRSQAATPLGPRASHRLMTGDEIRRIRSDRIEFGAHTLTHTALSERDPAAQAAEIHGSRTQCATITGVMPACFAYPYGDYDAHCTTLAEQAGFACACTTEAAAVTRPAKLHALPRIQAYDWDDAALAHALRTT